MLLYNSIFFDIGISKIVFVINFDNGFVKMASLSDFVVVQLFLFQHCSSTKPHQDREQLH